MLDADFAFTLGSQSFLYHDELPLNWNIAMHRIGDCIA